MVISKSHTSYWPHILYANESASRAWESNEKKCESVKLGGRVMVQVQSERRVRREASDYEMNRGMYSSSI